MRPPEYKPLLFTTTLRSPERLKDFLQILAGYDGQVLTPAVIEAVAKSLIQKGLYQPLRVDPGVKRKWKQSLELSSAETTQVFIDNPQHHKEAGFARGWPSRFDTWFKIAKELGFVWYNPNEQIIFSESGRMLIDKTKPENELLVFANAFAKYQRHNPFRRVLNHNVPLILLLQTIQLLNADPEYNGAGISRSEIPLLLCWQNSDAHLLYAELKSLRQIHGYSPSNEIILERCYALLNSTKRDDTSILGDYPDDFIRKMRLTGLFSLRGGGRFIDTNSKESAAIKYILEHYSDSPNLNTEKDFFAYLSQLDQGLISKLSVYNAPTSATKAELAKWLTHYSLDKLKAELLILAQKKRSNDVILKVIEQPLRLEFLTALALLKQSPSITVTPNFISDDEGLPTSCAPGGKPDIECLQADAYLLVEVTLLTGTQQHLRESFSTHRHLEEYLNRGLKATTRFISPQTFVDTQRYFNFIKPDGLEIQAESIAEFVKQLD